MNPLLGTVLKIGIPWLIELITDVCTKNPGMTAAELQAEIDALIDARKADPAWLQTLLDAHKAQFNTP